MDGPVQTRFNDKRQGANGGKTPVKEERKEKLKKVPNLHQN